MSNNAFEVKVLKLNWIQHVDDPNDLCAHGSVYVRIGTKVIIDEKDGDSWTVSATALHLLRTLQVDYKPGDFAAQLVPCCGFFIIASDDGKRAEICGCPSGFDWTIQHEGDVIRHTADTGEQAIIDSKVYRELVVSFADSVLQFYKDSAPKKLPEDNFDREGYQAFWVEWQTLRSKWT